MALDEALQDLIDKGQQIDQNMEQDKFQEWIQEGKELLNANFPRAGGIHSNEALAFRKVTNVEQGNRLLKSFMSRGTQQTGNIINVSQVTSVQNIFSLQIQLNIDYSKDLTEEQKKEVKDLYKTVETEVQKEKTDWSKVTGLLKKSFDYGLKIAPDIVKLADAYYKAKGGA